MKFPVLMINCKVYDESTGNNAVKLAKICESIYKKTKKSIVLCVSPCDVYRVSESAPSIPIFSEHIDGVAFGANTGKIIAKTIKQNKGKGSLVNHSEDRVSLIDIGNALAKLKELKLTSVVCSKTAKESKELAMFNPDMIAIEPPELIGGDISVTTANPKIVSNTVKEVHKVNSKLPVLCGAGVKTGEDVRKAIELGAKGVLVASGVTKAKNQRNAIMDLLKGFD